MTDLSNVSPVFVKKAPRTTARLSTKHGTFGLTKEVRERLDGKIVRMQKGISHPARGQSAEVTRILAEECDFVISTHHQAKTIVATLR